MRIRRSRVLILKSNLLYFGWENIIGLKTNHILKYFKNSGKQKNVTTIIFYTENLMRKYV